MQKLSLSMYTMKCVHVSRIHILHVFILRLLHFSEEWEWIKNLGSEDVVATPTTAQLKFQKALSSAIKNLLTLLEVPPEQTGDHR